jgi:hypothetical protein
VKEPYRTAMTVSSALLAEGNPDTFREELDYLFRYVTGFAIAVLEVVPREKLRWIPANQWAEMLQQADEPYRLAVQAIIARREMGPEHGVPTACEEMDLEQGRDWLEHMSSRPPEEQRSVFKM